MQLTLVRYDAHLYTNFHMSTLQGLQREKSTNKTDDCSTLSVMKQPLLLV